MSMITFCHALKRSPSTSIGLFILSSLVIIAIFAPWLAPQDPNWQNAADRDAPRDKCASYREINGIAAAFQYLQKNYIPTALSYL